jgi:hypothetical protein
MDAQDATLRLIGRIHEAVDDSQIWTVFLEELSNALSGTTTVLMYYGRDNAWKGGISQALRFDPDATRVGEHTELFSFSPKWVMRSKWPCRRVERRPNCNKRRRAFRGADRRRFQELEGCLTSEGLWLSSTCLAKRVSQAIEVHRKDFDWSDAHSCKSRSTE